jgi:hypothetical protein
VEYIEKIAVSIAISGQLSASSKDNVAAGFSLRIKIYHW